MSAFGVLYKSDENNENKNIHNITKDIIEDTHEYSKNNTYFLIDTNEEIVFKIEPTFFNMLYYTNSYYCKTGNKFTIENQHILFFILYYLNPDKNEAQKYAHVIETLALKKIVERGIKKVDKDMIKIVISSVRDGVNGITPESSPNYYPDCPDLVKCISLLGEILPFMAEEIYQEKANNLFDIFCMLYDRYIKIDVNKNLFPIDRLLQLEDICPSEYIEYVTNILQYYLFSGCGNIDTIYRKAQDNRKFLIANFLKENGAQYPYTFYEKMEEFRWEKSVEELDRLRNQTTNHDKNEEEECKNEEEGCKNEEEKQTTDYDKKTKCNISYNDNQLIIACMNGDLEMVKYLVDTLGANFSVNDEMPFLQACKNGHKDVIKYLVDKGVDTSIHRY